MRRRVAGVGGGRRQLVSKMYNCYKLINAQPIYNFMSEESALFRSFGVNKLLINYELESKYLMPFSGQ